MSELFETNYGEFSNTTTAFLYPQPFLEGFSKGNHIGH